MRPILGFVLFTGILVACGGNDNSSSVCGDGHVTGSEQCDDGNTVSGDGCSSTCHTETASSCGNGTVEVDKGEQCDDGNIVDGDGCSSTCQNEVINKCGNGHLDSGETCDDGNGASNDGCSSACAVEAGYSCSGTPSVCVHADGTCGTPFVLALTDSSGTLTGTGTGDTTGGANQVAATDCDEFYSGRGPDHVWKFTTTDTRDITITLDGGATPFDGVLRIMTAPCDLGQEYPEYLNADGCSDSGVGGDGEALALLAVPAGTYYVVVDGYDDTEFGAYSFTVSAAPTACGNGTLEGLEVCDDGNTTGTDGCTARCDQAFGYTCTTASPSVCTASTTCGNGTLDPGEECDDGNNIDGDRCAADCHLEADVIETKPDLDAAPQMLTAGHHIIRGRVTGGDADFYTFTLANPATVEIETYDTVDAAVAYDGVGTLTGVDCEAGDTVLYLFDHNGDITDIATALYTDDEDGAASCSYIGPNDTDGDTTQGLLPAGTYTIRVEGYIGAVDRYLIDVKVTPVPAPAAGELVLNEFMAADNMSDTNCDASTTGTDDEFVELVNVTTHNVDLTGVTIADSIQVRHTFAPAASGSMILAPGKAVVVWSGGAPACAGVTNWFVSSTGLLSLNDGGDTITIKNGGGDTVTTYTYPAATANKSFNLNPDITGTAYALHDAITGAVGAFSPGKRTNGTAF